MVEPVGGPPEPAPPRYLGPLLVLFFVSGFAALVYQVLWVRQLGLLFGSTAQAAALTIAIFFAGIASGGWFWGRWAPRLRSSLRAFGLVEIGVAVTALGHFLLLGAYHAVYPAIYTLIGHVPTFDILTKATIASVILLPPAFLMGGTLPLMGQHLVRERDRLGRTGPLLYGVNTAGSAAGALAAGFVLPLALGFRNAYLLAVGLDLVVGVTAVVMARGVVARHEPAAVSVSAPVAEAAHRRPLELFAVSPSIVWIVAFASGFATLAVEVVWTRLFAQVLQNSTYTYALVLATFLLALALGAGVANALSRLRRVSPEVVLGVLLVGSSAVVAVSPWLFHRMTEGFAYVGSGLGWVAYMLTVAGLAGIVMLVPGTVLGAVLPYLFRTLQGGASEPGEAIGRLIAANTTGAILGSLTAGFVFLPIMGTWRSLLLLAGIYPVLVAAVALGRLTRPRLAAAAAAATAAVMLVVVTSAGVEAVHLRAGDHLIDVREGPHANAAVVRSGNNLFLRVNNFYTLGSTRARHSERNQALVPMMTHPDPRSVFFLGMGTGITAGASLWFDVERVVVCEIVGDVIALAEEHFEGWTNGLFSDERVRIYAEDGRNCLSRSDDRYDVIVSDLFMPWKAGTGNLYTLEHYEMARERLEPGGIFAQWIPLYMVSDRELGIIARTMDEAFDQVVVWRSDLFTTESIVALIGYREAAPLDPTTLGDHGRQLSGDVGLADAFGESVILRFYAGSITESGLFDDRPLNTDTHPLIEYLAPRTDLAVRAGEGEFVVGAELERFYEDLHDLGPDGDPYLSRLTPEQLGYVSGGYAYWRSVVLAARGHTAEAREQERRFLDLMPAGARDYLAPSPDLVPDLTGSMPVPTS